MDILQLEVENFDPTLIDALNLMPTVENLISHPSELTWSLALHTTDSRALLPEVIDLVGSRGGQIRSMQVAQPTLEDVFISLTGKQLRE